MLILLPKAITTKMIHVSKGYDNKRGVVRQLSNEDIVREYFRGIKSKDINRLLDLFTEDAVIHEPFSKLDRGKTVLRGKSTIESFLKVATMASDGLKQEIEFEKPELRQDSHSDRVICYVTFERGGKTRARFTFELGSEQNHNPSKQKKILALRIEFIT
jgi:ketosteroid isomerase-like protein